MDFKRPWIRLAVSAFLLFHLGAVLLAPNPSSYLTQSLSTVYRPYTNLFGLAHTWGFFAPEPVSPPMYIDYVIQKRSAPAVSGRFPPEQNPYFFRDRHNRRMSLSKFILSNDDNIKNMFVRYLCLQENDILSINLWRVVATQPSLKMVQDGEKKMTDPVDFKIEVLGTYYCPEQP
jgi:hypothetical protein